LLDVPLPEVGPHDVLVQILAAGVNPVDYLLREGWVPPKVAGTGAPWRFRPEKAPDRALIMGSDFAGKVAKVGAAVREFAVGDEVYGYKILGNGTYAEFVSVPAS